MPGQIGGRESGFVLFREGDEVRVNDDAVLAPEAIRGQVGTIRRVNRFRSEPAGVSESGIAVDRYLQLVKQPRETEILGFALQVHFPKVGDSMIVASNEVTLLSKFRERIAKLEEKLFIHLTDPQQFCVLSDGGLDAPFINQSFDAPFFGDIVRYVLRPNLPRDATKVLSPVGIGATFGGCLRKHGGVEFRSRREGIRQIPFASARQLARRNRGRREGPIRHEGHGKLLCNSRGRDRS